MPAQSTARTQPEAQHPEAPLAPAEIRVLDLLERFRDIDPEGHWESTSLDFKALSSLDVKGYIDVSPIGYRITEAGRAALAATNEVR